MLRQWSRVQVVLCCLLCILGLQSLYLPRQRSLGLPVHLRHLVRHGAPTVALENFIETLVIGTVPNKENSQLLIDFYTHIRAPGGFD